MRLVLVLGVLTLLGCSEGKQAVYDRPLGNCLEMRDLLRNRRYPPPHNVHSYAKDVPICKPKSTSVR